MLEITNYHLHFFFELDQVEYVEEIHRQVTTDWSSQISIFPLLLRPAGPLPKPMFMLTFSKEYLENIIVYFSNFKAQFSIFIHPDLADEKLAHTEYAIWLGHKIPLRLSYLD